MSNQLQTLALPAQLAGQLTRYKQQLQRATPQLRLPSSLRQAPTRGPAKSAPNGNGGCDCPSRRSDDQLARIIRREIQHALGDADAGVIYPGDRDIYTPYRRVGGEAGKGGVVVSDAMTVQTDATAGDTFTTSFTDQEADRMAGERLCAIQAILPDELVDVSDRMIIELLISGDSINQANRIPLDYISKTATGEIQRVPVYGRDGEPGYRVPMRGTVQVRATVLAELGGADAGVDVLFRAETGESCG